MIPPLRRKTIGRWLMAFALFGLAHLGFPNIEIGLVPSAACETDKGDKEEAAPDSADEAALKKKHAEYLKQMRERSAAAKVRIAGAETDADLILEPLMRFNNRSLRNADATLWGWTSKGRLVGVCKLARFERFRPDEGPWLFCFTSLSPERVEAEFGGGHKFSAEKPGIELKTIDNAAAPGEGKAERLRRMKEISSRFTGTTTDYANHSEELRLLPRPIYRYQQPDGDLLDGAVFALSIEGTAPTALVLIELHRKAEGTSDWQFAVAASTWQAVSVKLDEREVWTKPVVVRPGNYDTWASFWEQ
jgi:hypothetical protein